MAKQRSTDAPAPEGHNGALTDDERSDLIAYYGDKIRRQNRVAAEAKAAYDSERDELKSLFAKVKGDLLITRKDFEAVLLAGDMTEAEFRHAEAKRANLFKLAGLPVGEQIDMFAHAADTADEQAMAYENGRRAGLRGDDPKAPDSVSPVLVPNWEHGWSDGQKELGERLIRAAAVIEARKAPAEPEAEPEAEEEFDPDSEARKLRRAGFLERAEADAEAELEDA